MLAPVTAELQPEVAANWPDEVELVRVKTVGRLGVTAAPPLVCACTEIAGEHPPEAKVAAGVVKASLPPERENAALASGVPEQVVCPDDVAQLAAGYAFTVHVPFPLGVCVLLACPPETDALNAEIVPEGATQANCSLEVCKLSPVRPAQSVIPKL